MKYLSLTAIAALGLCVANNGIAESATECITQKDFQKEHRLLCAKPEIGLDIGLSRAEFKSDSGEKLLNRKIIPFNVFFGININDSWGIELGYGEAKKQYKHVRLEAGEAAPGADRVDPGAFQTYDTTMSFSQPYVSLKFKRPIDKKLHFFAAAGISPFKAEFSWINLGDETGTPPALAITSTLRSRTVNVRKTIGLAKMGFYYSLNQSFSVRATATWINTSKIKTHVEQGSAGFVPMDLKLKDTIYYSIGITYSI